MNAPPLLSLAGLSAHHGPVEVLRDVTLDVAPREAVALLGRNGAGKTTLVHALFNLGPGMGGPRLGGTVRVDGAEVTGWPTHRIARLGLALVPQGRGTFPTLTVAENLRLATVRRRPGPRKPEHGAPEQWTLERVLDTFPRLAERRAAPGGSLSGGERQLLAIGRALLTQPRLLVLDEPSEGLAPMAAEEILLGEVGRLVEQGLTVLLAEQNVALALRLCPRAVVLAGGGVAFDGPSEALLAERGLLREHLGV